MAHSSSQPSGGFSRTTYALTTIIATAVGALIGAVADNYVALPGSDTTRLVQYEARIDSLEVALNLAQQTSSQRYERLQSQTREIAALEDSIRQLAARLPPPPPPSDRVAEKQGFRIVLDTCTRSGSVVECELTVTNTEADRVLRLASSSNNYGRSSAYTGTGTIHSATGTTVGTRTQRGYSGDTLIQGEPVNASVRFRDVSREAALLTTVDLWFWSGGSSFNVRYENVSIEG